MKMTIGLVILLFSAGLSETLSFIVQPDYDGLQIIRDGVYDKVVLPDYPGLGIEGEPDLPHMLLRIALPTGCSAENVTITNYVFDTLSSTYAVIPVIPILCSIDAEPAFPRPDEHIYASSSFYPANVLGLWQSGVLWGIPLASAWIRPIHWNPATGELRVLRMLELAVEYEEAQIQPNIRVRTQWSEDRAREILCSFVLNPGDVGYSGATIFDPKQLEYGQYVVITCPEYQLPMQELADWKTAKGIPTSIYTTDWVSGHYPCIDLQQSVRAFLTDCIDEGVDFVLLVGDNDVFEARFTYPSNVPAWLPLPSDLYYADNNDTEPGFDMWDSNGNGRWGEPDDNLEWHPDLWVGRASVNSLEEAEIFVDKVLIYEHVQETGAADMLSTESPEMRFGYTTGYLNPPYAPRSVYAEQISAMVPYQWTEEKCYESWGNNSTAITIAMINSGPHQVFHANHGAFDCMYTSYGDLFTVDDIMELQNITNSGSVAIWISIACEIGAFDSLTSCADAWLNAPEGGGFACMNARSVFVTPSFAICEAFYNAYMIDGFFELGIAHGLALDNLCPPGGGTTAGATVQGNNLFGDPELPMWLIPRGSLNVDHPSSIERTNLIPVHVTSPSGISVENARVCLQKGPWQTGEVYEIGYTDAAGQVSLWVSRQTPGEITITVWAHDFDTYSGCITVDSSGTQEEFTVALLKVFPNPSPSPAMVSFSLSETAFVELRVFDISGRLVSTPVSETFECGIHEIPVGDLCSGIYFARMDSGGFSDTQRFVVIR
ncbi:MAG: T9SS type A sorting domain-containing protein [Candidatus Aegiribacteria sp.]|nr:T9SS type A sorting domain-containing protein [Candidatus Aegiribacteria sp.]